MPRASEHNLKNEKGVRDMDYPQKVANVGSKLIKEYLAELRKEGKVKGKMSLVIRKGPKKIVLDYKD